MLTHNLITLSKPKTAHSQTHAFRRCHSAPILQNQTDLGRLSHINTPSKNQKYPARALPSRLFCQKKESSRSLIANSQKLPSFDPKPKAKTLTLNTMAEQINKNAELPHCTAYKTVSCTGSLNKHLAQSYDPILELSLEEYWRSSNETFIVVGAVRSNNQASSDNEQAHASFYLASSIARWWGSLGDRGVNTFVDPNTGLKANSIDFYAITNTSEQLSEALALPIGQAKVSQESDFPLTPATKLYLASACATATAQKDVYALAIAFLNILGESILFPATRFEHSDEPLHNKALFQPSPELGLHILQTLYDVSGPAYVASVLEQTKHQLAKLLSRDPETISMYTHHFDKVLTHQMLTSSLHAAGA